MKKTRRSGARTRRRSPALAGSATYSLSQAKTYLGRLVEQVLAGETVYIIRGQHRFVLQHVPQIEPIPMRPPGYFTDLYSKAESEEDNELGNASVVSAPEDLE